MNVALRHGLGDALEDYWDSLFTPEAPAATEDTGGSLYAQLIAQGVNPVDAEAYLTSGQLPGGSTGASTSPGAELTPAELAKEQATARDWLAHAFDPLNVNKIAQALKSGAAIVSKGLNAAGQPICPSGVAYPNGQCIETTGTKQWLPGVPNQTVAIVGVAFLALMMGGGGGRRR